MVDLQIQYSKSDNTLLIKEMETLKLESKRAKIKMYLD